MPRVSCKMPRVYSVVTDCASKRQLFLFLLSFACYIRFFRRSETGDDLLLWLSFPRQEGDGYKHKLWFRTFGSDARVLKSGGRHSTPDGSWAYDGILSFDSESFGCSAKHVINSHTVIRWSVGPAICEGPTLWLKKKHVSEGCKNIYMLTLT